MKTVSVAALICLASTCIAYTQFSAEMINVVQGNQREYKVYSDLDRYRYEFEESGKKGIVIVHPEQNKTYVLMPDEQYVHITSCDGMMSRMNDPWQSYLWFKKYGTEKDLGNDEINGYQCDKPWSGPMFLNCKDWADNKPGANKAEKYRQGSNREGSHRLESNCLHVYTQGRRRQYLNLLPIDPLSGFRK
jgi:hypothetical protein